MTTPVYTTSQAVALFNALVSHVTTLGVFARVNSHEPVNTPGRDLSCTVTLDAIEPDAAGSGVAAVSGKIVFAFRLWSPADQRPLDAVDPKLLGAVSAVCGSLAGGFTLGEPGVVRNVDLFGMRVRTYYLNHEGKELRIAEITVPVEVNDLWSEVA